MFIKQQMQMIKASAGIQKVLGAQRMKDTWLAETEDFMEEWAWEMDFDG